MERNEVSKLILLNMNTFHNLVKIVNNEKFKTERTLTEKQFFALSSIKKHKKIELKNLSKDLYVSTSSLCILLNKLVEKGYVYREEDSKDRRNTFYGITEEGEKIFLEEINEILSIIESKLSGISDNEISKLLAAMSEVDSIMGKLF